MKEKYNEINVLVLFICNVKHYDIDESWESELQG